MKPKSKILLLVDGIVNLLLGILLLLFPFGMAQVFGVPQSNSNFYPTILGAVIFGIGVSLFLEVYGKPRGIHGLGLVGAVVINFCGAGVLTLWLISDPFKLPLRGYIILWTIAIVVLALGCVELFGKSWKGMGPNLDS
jgi:peptidoglycan/LPS O-acetylase OafA/YrhL